MTGLDHEVTRYLQGTISMIKDGVVRWSLVSILLLSCYLEEGTDSVCLFYFYFYFYFYLADLKSL